MTPNIPMIFNQATIPSPLRPPSTATPIQNAPIHNPYQPRLIPTTVLTWITGTLQLWITPRNNNPQPVPVIHPIGKPANPDIPPNPIQPIVGGENINQQIQQILIPQCTNAPWGDTLESPKQFGTFWVVSKNVNMLSFKQSYLL